MPNQPVITEEVPVVEEITQEPTQVSGGQTPVAVPAPQPVVQVPRSDPNARISALQSQLQKAQNQLTQLIQEKTDAVLKQAQLQQELEKVVTQSTSMLNEASRATQEALDRATKVTQENATLSAKVAKLNYLNANPDLVPFAELLPETVNVQELEAKANVVRTARQNDINTIKTQLQTGVVPPATPTKPNTNMSSAEMNAYLLEALGDEKEFMRRRDECVKMASQK